MHGRIYNFFIQVNWLSAATIGFLFGVLIASFFTIIQSILIIVTFLSSFLLVVFFKNHYIKIATLIFLFFVVGILYFNFQGNIPKDKFEYYDLQQETQFFTIFKNGLLQGLDRALLPPHSSFYKAVILGDKSGITYNMRDGLSHTGLSHVVAVSGMHIAILTFIIFWFLLRFFKRRYAGLIALGILTFYILMIGAPASAVRAGIMAGVLVLAQLVGRPNSALRALLYAAGIMVALNPIIIKFDIGFQLSFLAVFGILVFYKSLDKFFRLAQYKIVEFIARRPITKDRNLAVYFAEQRFTVTSLFAVTITAQIFTAPLIFYYFEIFSFVSPITNILVVPILPFALISL